jgi:hypothetical protein
LIIAAGSRRKRREPDDAQKSMVWLWHECMVSGHRRIVCHRSSQLKIAAFGAAAEAEACRMVSEKIETGWLYRGWR